MWRWLACGLLLGAAGCRPKACDDAELLEVAKTFEDRSSAGRAAGLAALEDACPALPHGLLADLRSRFRYAPGDPDAVGLALPEMHGVFRFACPGMPEGRESDDFDRSLREWCDIDRYGVLGVDEPFVRDDLFALMLYDWLTSTGADPDVARTIARALMYVSASDDERELWCLRRSLGCAHIVARLGIDLPRSTSNVPLDDAVDVLISRTHVSVDGEQVLALADDGFERHVARTLLAALESRTEPDRVMRVEADLTTRFETLANVVFTATKADYETIDLAVLDDESLHRIVLVVPRQWMRPREWPRYDRPLPLELHVHRDAVEVTVFDRGKRFDSEDHAAIDEEMKKYKELYPHETVATFVVDDDVTLQALVSVMDVARGVDCKLPLDDAEVPEACLFWQPIIDTEPGLFWNIDLIEAIHLGDPSIDVREAGGVSPKPILRALASHRDAIEACLRSELEQLRDLEDELLLVIARSPDGSLVARTLDHGFHDTPVEHCVLGPLDLQVASVTNGFVFRQSAGLEVRIPVTFDLR